VEHLVGVDDAGGQDRPPQGVRDSAIFILVAGTFTSAHGLLFRGPLRWGPLALVGVGAGGDERGEERQPGAVTPTTAAQEHRTRDRESQRAERVRGGTDRLVESRQAI
jgi:hypothetical protein